MRDIQEIRYLEGLLHDGKQEGLIPNDAAETVRNTLLWVTGECMLSAVEFAAQYVKTSEAKEQGSALFTEEDIPSEASTKG